MFQDATTPGRGRETHKQVDVRGPHGLSIQQLQDLASRPIVRDGIRRRLEAVERILPLLVRGDAAAQVAVVLVRVLLLVEPVGGGLPGVDDDAGDGRRGERVDDLAVHVCDDAVGGGVLDDGAAVGD